MRPVFEAALLIGGGILRMFDFGSDLWYFTVQEYGNDLLYYFSGVFLVTPSFLFLLVTCCYTINDCCKLRFQPLPLKIGLGLLIAIGEPVGISQCVFGTLILSNPSDYSGRSYIELLSRAGSFVEGVFETLPQFIIQFYNNQMLDSWNYLSVISMTISILSLVYTCLKLGCAIDRLKKEEAEVSPGTELPNKRQVVPDQGSEEMEVYDFSY
mmetsp:Transcript_741/g.1184  ORF Transcript_741/g.1184 Transcript_741/m.1184 type:complete len:211 (-) Transcript_741:1096-1728(-)